MTELYSPEIHIFISTRGYRECLNSACEIEILEGYIKRKVKLWISLKVIKNRCSCRTTFTLNAKTLGNVPRTGKCSQVEMFEMCIPLDKTWNIDKP